MTSIMSKRYNRATKLIDLKRRKYAEQRKIQTELNRIETVKEPPKKRKRQASMTETDEEILENEALDEAQ